MPTLIILTGASRGLGLYLAKAFAPRFPAAHYALLARNGPALQATAAAIAEVQPSATASTHVVDFGALETLESVFAGVLAALPASPAAYKNVVLVHNSGSLGQLGPVASLDDLVALRAAIDSNVTSVMWLSHLFLKWVKSLPAAPRAVRLVNISSLAALEPFTTHGVYCTGKAARDMFLRTIAVEEKEGGIKTLNYAPGPLDTDMQAQIRGSAEVDAGTREYFQKMKEEVSASFSRGRRERVGRTGD